MRSPFGRLTLVYHSITVVNVGHVGQDCGHDVNCFTLGPPPMDVVVWKPDKNGRNSMSQIALHNTQRVGLSRESRFLGLRCLWNRWLLWQLDCAGKALGLMIQMWSLLFQPDFSQSFNLKSKHNPQHFCANQNLPAPLKLARLVKVIVIVS